MRFRELTGAEYDVDDLIAGRMVAGALVVQCGRLLLELPHIRRHRSTLYLDDRTRAGRSYRDELVQTLTRARTSKPRSAYAPQSRADDGYVPVPHGWGR